MMDLSITKTNIEPLTGLERKLSFELSAENIQKEVDGRLKELQKTARIAGFRPGKAPMRVIQQRYGKRVHDEVLQEAGNQKVLEAADKEGVRPASIFSLSNTTELSKDKKEVQFEVTLEAYPEVKIAGLDKVEIIKPVVEITEKDIDAMIENLRNQASSWQQVKRAAKNGDKILADAQCIVENNIIRDWKDIAIVLGQGSFPPKVEEAAVGIPAGDSFDEKIRLPGDYEDKELAGKELLYKVTVKQVEEMVLPEVNEEFIKSYGVASGDNKEFRKELLANMERRLDDMVVNKIGQQIMSGLLEKNKFDVPKSLVNNAIYQFKVQMLRSEGVKIENEQQLQEYLSRIPTEPMVPRAEYTVRSQLILDSYIRSNKLKTEPKKIDEAIEKLSKSFERPAEYVRWAKSNEEEVRRIESYVLERDAYSQMLEKVKVNEQKQSFEEAMLPEQPTQPKEEKKTQKGKKKEGAADA